MLVDYAALRAEVDRRATVQWNVLALQLTSTGVIANLCQHRLKIDPFPPGEI
jgi:hypothetical protein